MPRSLWTGTVSFGLVAVPVRLLTATAPKSVRFHQLHADDGGRIVQKRTCSIDGKEIEFSDIAKGYDVGGGNYVMVEQDELAALDPEATRSIDIDDFVDLSEIDPVYFDHTYYLAPEDKATKPYSLLVEAMSRSGKVAIGRFVLRNKQHLVALRVRDGVLVLETMLYPDELIEPETLEVPTAEDTSPSDRELTMATQLVESLSVAFDPSKYYDDYREKVMALVDAKAEGKTFAQPEAEEEDAPVIDLMAALEASLAAAKKRDSAGVDEGEADEKRRERRKASA